MVSAARPYYARLRMDGFPGEKDVVFIPDDLVLDSKGMGLIMKALRMNPPNLLIEGVGSSVHPINILTENEISLLAKQGIVGKQADTQRESQMIREVMVNKLNAITSAIMQGLQETGSAFIAFSTWMITFDIIGARALRTLGGSVQGISTFHANDPTISDPRTIQTIKDLLAAAVPLDINTKEINKPNVVHSDGRWLLNGMEQPWEDHSCLTKDRTALMPPKERKPTSQWCNPMAQTLFIFFARKTNSDKAEWDESPKVGMGFDPLTQRDLVAPPGMIFIGGASQSVKDSYTQCFENAVPALIIKYTGGITNIYAELVESLRKVLSGDATELSLVAQEEEKHLAQEAATGSAITKRMAMVCPQRLLHKAYELSAQDQNDAVKVTIADVVKLLDLAKARPQVFLHTIKVFDPVAQSQSQALDVLSECVSSTYVGLVSLGASSDDILHEASMMRQSFASRSQHLYVLNKIFVHTAAISTWLALFFASFHASFDSCKERLQNPNASVGFFCKDIQSHLPDIFSTLVVVVPITTGFVTTLMSYFRYQQKWAAAKMAGEEIESHIFQFRASTGPYARRGALQNEEAEDEPSNRNVDALVRHRFSSNLQRIYVQALATDLNNDYVELDQIDPEEAVPWPPEAWTTVVWEWLHHCAMCPVRCCLQKGGVGGATKSDDIPLMPAGPGGLHTALLQRSTSEGPSASHGSFPSQLLQAKSQDDGVSPLTGDEYHDLRFQSLKASYLKKAPMLSRAQQHMNSLILTGGLISALLGAYRMSIWIPVVVGFTSMLQSLMVHGNSGAELAAVNRSLGVLQSMSVQWKALSRMDRRAPRFKEQMVTLTEQAHMAVVQTQTGVGMLLQGAGEDSEETEQDDQKAKTSKTKANAPQQSKDQMSKRRPSVVPG